MPSNKQSKSIKSILVFAVLSIATLALLVAFTASTRFEIEKHKERLQKDSITYADIAAFNAASSILFDDPETEKKRLESFKVTPFIENVHIYKLDDYSDELSFFASYNKAGFPPVPAKFSQLDELKQPQFGSNHIELARPIRFEGELIGYIYLRGSTERLQNFINSTVLTAVTVSSLALLLSLALVLRMQRRISQPIEALIDTAQKVSRQKDYSVRAPMPGLQELDFLAKAFNTMLDRIERHIDKQQHAEHEVRRLNQNLEEKVKQRTMALKEANQELLSTLEKLHQYQHQLVENEKMASLGDMVAGVAHEVNTPIGLGVTASTLLRDRLADIRIAFDEKKLTAGQLDKFINEGDENLGIIYRNLNRAAELISSFKQVAVDQSNEGNRQIILRQLLHEVLLSLNPKLKHHKHKIHIDCDESLCIESKPGPINQILINLIINSIVHGFEFIEQGNINISVKIENLNILYMNFKDDGKGVPETLRRKIFDPFVTTKRGEGGSGLGMHLVYNLVTQALNGSIQVMSEEGKGIEFDIRFPIKVIEPTGGQESA